MLPANDPRPVQDEKEHPERGHGDVRHQIRREGPEELEQSSAPRRGQPRHLARNRSAASAQGGRGPPSCWSRRVVSSTLYRGRRAGVGKSAVEQGVRSSRLPARSNTRAATSNHVASPSFAMCITPLTPPPISLQTAGARSEERRVGKEWRSWCPLLA